MSPERPIQITPETPREHAEAYLAQITAEKEAHRARALVHRLQNARTTREDSTTTVVIGDKAITMLWRVGRGGGWQYIVSDVVA